MGVVVDFDPYVSFLTNKSVTVKNDFDRQRTSQYRNLGLFLSDNHMQQLNLTDSIAPSDFLLNSLKKYSSSCL